MYRKKSMWIILMLLLIIGFASVTTTLVLNGKVGIGVELDDFDVIFIESLLDGKENEKSTISEDKKTITFSTDKLISVGDASRLNYKVKNTSTQYNADVEINCTNETSEYVNVTSSFDGNQIPLVLPINIKAQEVKSGYINAELIKAYAGEDTSIEIKCTINVTATSRETYAYSLNFNSNGGSEVDDKSVVLNEEYGKLEEPIREGYTFLGWYDEEDNKVDETTILDSKGNRNLKAKWEVNEYPVTIKTNEHGNSEVNSINVVYNETINVKVTPNKNYYLSSVECSDGYSIENFDSKIPIYEEQSITIRNNKKAESGECVFTFGQGIFEYNYIGSEQTLIVPVDGTYKVELVGGKGGNSFSKIGSVHQQSAQGEKGSQVISQISLSKDDLYYILVGGSGTDASSSVIPNGGYNGGGYGGRFNGNISTAYVNCGAGGGATDIRSKLDDLTSRIAVAGGGAGAGGNAYMDLNDVYALKNGNISAKSNNTLLTGSTGAVFYANGNSNGNATRLYYGAGGGGLYGGSAGFAGTSLGDIINYGVGSGNGYAKITLVSID